MLKRFFVVLWSCTSLFIVVVLFVLVFGLNLCHYLTLPPDEDIPFFDDEPNPEILSELFFYDVKCWNSRYGKTKSDLTLLWTYEGVEWTWWDLEDSEGRVISYFRGDSISVVKPKGRRKSFIVWGYEGEAICIFHIERAHYRVLVCAEEIVCAE